MTEETRTPKSTAELRRRIRTEGAEAAFDALLRVCRDPKATAQALASAGGSIFRAAGFFEKLEAGEDKEPHEMTPSELQARIEKLRRDRAEGRSDDDADGVFD